MEGWMIHPFSFHIFKSYGCSFGHIFYFPIFHVVNLSSNLVIDIKNIYVCNELMIQ
jgi:hypothetical protein